MATQCPASFERRPSGAEMLTTNTSLEKGPNDCIDSGYGSSQTTPYPSPKGGNYDLGRKGARQLFSSSKKTKLRPFDQEISQAVQNRFSDLTELFGPSLYSFLVKRGVKYTAISIKLKVLGKDEGSARPWVVVQCDKAASKSINSFFDQPGVRSEYQRGDSEPDLPSFDVVIHPRAPVSLAASDQGIVYGKSWTNVDTLCGNIIKIGSLDKPHIATLGGIIMIEIRQGVFKMVGLTAGHILTQEQVAGHDNGRESPSTSIYTAHSSWGPAPTQLKAEVQKVEDCLARDVGHPQEQEDEESADGFELELEDFDIDTEANERSSMAVELELSRKPLAPLPHVEGFAGATSSWNPYHLASRETLEQFWSKIGSIYSSSRDVHARLEPNQQSGPDHDWALVDIDPLMYQPNLFADQPSGANMVDLSEISDEFDPPLYPRNLFANQPFGAKMVDLTELSGELDKSKGSRAVILVSGTGGLKRGILSLSPSFLILGQAKSFTKTYTLVLHDGTAPNTGDSGSWVIDEWSYGVYGHLVASDALKDAYVVPFDKILLDIKHSLGALSICLPTRRQIYAWHRGSHVDLRSNELPERGIPSPPSIDSGYVSNQVSPYLFEQEELKPNRKKRTSRSIEPELPVAKRTRAACRKKNEGDP